MSWRRFGSRTSRVFYHEKAAKRMRVSRATLGRILENARKKIARVLVEGKALRIEEPNRSSEYIP
jgi:predicted DNA-binding protein (UPF0251 family)